MSGGNRSRGLWRRLHGRALHARRGERRLFAVVAIVTAVLMGFGGSAVAYISLVASGPSSATAETLSAPTNLTATATTTGVSLSWSDPAPWTSTATTKPPVDYVVYRCTDGGCIPTVTSETLISTGTCASSITSPLTKTSCTDTSVSTTTTYGYAVVAVYHTWVSPPSTTEHVESPIILTAGRCYEPYHYLLRAGSTVDFTLVGAGGGDGGGWDGSRTGGAGAAGAEETGTLENTTSSTKWLWIGLGCKGGTGHVPSWWYGLFDRGLSGGGLSVSGGNGGTGHGNGGGGGGGGGSSAIYVTGSPTLLTLAGGGGGGGGGVHTHHGKTGLSTYSLTSSTPPASARGDTGHDADCTPWHTSCGGGGGGGGGVHPAASGGSGGAKNALGDGGANGVSYVAPTTMKGTGTTGVVVTLTGTVSSGHNPVQNGAVHFTPVSTTITGCSKYPTTFLLTKSATATFALKGGGGGAGGGGSGGAGAEVAGTLVNKTGSSKSVKVYVGCAGKTASGNTAGGTGGLGYAAGGNGGEGHGKGHGGGGGGGASAIQVDSTVVAVAGGGGGGSKSGGTGKDSLASGTKSSYAAEPGRYGANGASRTTESGGGGGGGGAGTPATGGAVTHGGAGGYSYPSTTSTGLVTGVTVTVSSTVATAGNPESAGSAKFTDPPSTPATVRTPVQSAGDSTAPGSTATAMLPTTVAAGDALVLSVGLAPGSGGVTTVSGGGVSWHEAVASSDAAIYYGLGSTGGTRAVTVTATGTITMANLSEWTDIGGLDTAAEATGTGGTVSAGTLGLAASHELVISSGTIQEQTDGTTTITKPFGELDIAGGTLSDTAYLDSGAGTTFDPAWAQVSATESWSALAAAFTSAGTTATATAPTVTSVSPGTGPVAGGTSVTITGTNFTTTATVSFGSTAAASVTVDSPTSITAVAPPYATAGAVTVTVTTKDGSALLGDGFTYTTGSATSTATTGATGTKTTTTTGTTGTTGSKTTAPTATTGSATSTATTGATGTTGSKTTTTTAATASKTTAPTATTSTTGSKTTTSKTTTSKTPKSTTPGTAAGTTTTGSTPA